MLTVLSSIPVLFGKKWPEGPCKHLAVQKCRKWCSSAGFGTQNLGSAPFWIQQTRNGPACPTDTQGYIPVSFSHFHFMRVSKILTSLGEFIAHVATGWRFDADFRFPHDAGNEPDPWWPDRELLQLPLRHIPVSTGVSGEHAGH